jgi:galactokinase/mevalonate kinase-like predicted kinase
MVEALRAADLANVGRLLSANWICQQALDPGMRTDEMGRLEQTMTDYNVLGGKAAGAGAGGSMFFLTREPDSAIVDAARAAGATVLPLRWAPEGCRAW